MPHEIHNSTGPLNSLPENRPRRQPRLRRPRPGQKNNIKPPLGVRHEVSAGGIIFRRRNGIVEIFFIKDPFGRWTFPKGHVEPGEALSDTAIRECDEEAGLKGLKFIAPLGRTAFRFRRQGMIVQKTVHFFLLEAPPTAKEHFVTREELVPGKEPIFEGKWVRPNEVFSVSSYKNSDRLLANALREISFQRSQVLRGPKV